MSGTSFDAREVAELMQGGIDIHIHANPHLFPDIHAQDVIDLSRDAQAAGMRALVVKDMGGPTTGAAYVVTRLGGGVPVYGAHVMNLSTGGINPRAVWVNLRHGDGAKVVHFPTGDTRNHFEYRKRFYAGVNLGLTEEQAITVLRDGKLIPEAREVISMIKECDACLATSHLSAVESRAVIREAKDQGLRRIIVSHARWKMTGLTTQDLHDFADLGCLIECDYCLMTALMQVVHGEAPLNPMDMAKTMHEIGPERCFMSSDLGQVFSVLPVEGMRTYVGLMRKCGISAADIRTMFHRNPARLIGLE